MAAHIKWHQLVSCDMKYLQANSTKASPSSTELHYAEGNQAKCLSQGTSKVSPVLWLLRPQKQLLQSFSLFVPMLVMDCGEFIDFLEWENIFACTCVIAHLREQLLGRIPT